ncbi:MAG: isoprenyl transferase [Prevotellaceae bacterium]|jgi:undecaprenyl diphosphate synthase|nr:isoprenyl transferase [Prevotellaceae bacterium]
MSSFLEKIDKGKLPVHIAIIMDGNGRWAKRQGLGRIFGHTKGVDAVREVTTAAAELGVGYLTLYVFSTENWARPQAEVNALMELLINTIEKETPVLKKNNISLRTIGNLDRLPPRAHEKMRKCIADTADCTGLRLVLALSYSARWEIVNAVQKIVTEAISKKIAPEDIDEKMLSSHLTTADMPDPDLMIRTSGEERISNFLLWQLAYSELYFTPLLWPEFGREQLYEAICEFQKRDRRFGK